MAFHPVFHGVCESLRFDRVLFVEIAPGPPPGHRCRYCDSLFAPGPARSHFSVPDAAARVILSELDRGVSVDAFVFGGSGDPLRHGGVGSLLRKIRATTHVPTILLTDGALLRDRDVRSLLSDAQSVASVSREVERAARVRLDGLSPEEMTDVDLLKEYLKAKDTPAARKKLLLKHAQEIIDADADA